MDQSRFLRSDSQPTSLLVKCALDNQLRYPMKFCFAKFHEIEAKGVSLFREVNNPFREILCFAKDSFRETETKRNRANDSK